MERFVAMVPSNKVLLAVLASALCSSLWFTDGGAAESSGISQMSGWEYFSLSWF